MVSSAAGITALEILETISVPSLMAINIQMHCGCVLIVFALGINQDTAYVCRMDAFCVIG